MIRCRITVLGVGIGVASIVGLAVLGAGFGIGPVPRLQFGSPTGPQDLVTVQGTTYTFQTLTVERPAINCSMPESIVSGPVDVAFYRTVTFPLHVADWGSQTGGGCRGGGLFANGTEADGRSYVHFVGNHTQECNCYWNATAPDREFGIQIWGQRCPNSCYSAGLSAIRVLVRL